MRKKLLVLLSFILITGHASADDTTKDPNDLGTISTNDYHTYHNVHLINVTPLGLRCSWTGGIGLLDFQKLSPELQKKYGYDAAKYNEAETQQAQHDAENDDAVAQAQKNQAKVDASNEAEEENHAREVATPKKIENLVGTVIGNVDGGYEIQVDPLPPPPDGGVQGITPNSYELSLARFNATRVPEGTYILKTTKVHTMGEVLAIPGIPVVESGVYVLNGNNYKSYEEAVSQTP